MSHETNHEPRPTEARDDRQQAFEDAWRHRAARPPALAPEEAAGEVLRRLAERRETPAVRRPLRLLTAGALALVLLAAVASLLYRTAPPAVPPRAGQVAAPGATPSEDVLVLWLDAETPLYLTLEPPADGGADRKETMR